MSTVLFAGGGSIGHIAPSVAVADSLKAIKPDTKIHFVCSSHGEDTQFLKDEGFDYTPINAPRLSLSFPWRFFSAYKKASALLKELSPQVVFSKGGYVSVPVCLAAHRKKIPIVLHESDAVSGRANRLVSRWAKEVCSGFPIQNALHTGNPIRKEVINGNQEEGLRITGFSGNKPILIVMGGSQGAQALNKMITNNLEKLLESLDIIHLTGDNKLTTQNQEGYWAKEFAHEELPHLYAISSLALSRAGAGSIAELSANSIPTILVPLEGVANDHQLKNAKIISESNGFILLRQKDLNSNLINSIQDLVASNQKHKPSNPPKDAARQIAEILSKYLA
jgi:UDP-N-acetylglucosamine--N-acetylmuramyl-(pentapeptide) pyrophosphoryl-undecaprenol N-acetylglucosamine transferase